MKKIGEFIPCPDLSALSHLKEPPTDLFGNPIEQPKPKKVRARGTPRNERDEIFDYFYRKLCDPWQRKTNRPLGKAFLAMKIAHLKIGDLYYLKSVCLDAEHRGDSFSKVFWGSLKPREQ